MDLIIIHGAPAVGKYTVAKELKKATGFKLAHIHSVYDFLESIFGKEKYEISLKITNNTFLEIFEESAKLKIKGLIFTYAELSIDNFVFVKKIKQKLKKYKINLFFIHLSCNEKDLRKRVIMDSRKKFKKTTNLEELKYLLSIKDYKLSFPNSKTLKINNTKLSPKKVVKKIMDYYSFDE